MSVTINFKAAFGPVDKNVEMSIPLGGGGENFHILMDNYFIAQVVKYSDSRWHVRFVKPDLYTSDDADALLDRINDYFKENPHDF